PVGVSEARTRRMRFLTRVAAVVSSLWVADTSLRTAQGGPYAPTSRSQSPLSRLREQLTSGLPKQRLPYAFPPGYRMGEPLAVRAPGRPLMGSPAPQPLMGRTVPVPPSAPRSEGAAPRL